MTFSEGEIYELLSEYCRDSIELKALMKRNFRQHSNYINYRYVALLIAQELITIPKSIQMPEHTTPTWSACVHSFWGAYQNPDFPVYALTKDLLEGFIDSTPPQQLWGMRRMFDRALVLFPKGSIKNPDGLDLEWVLIDYLEPYEEINKNEPFRNYLDQKVGYKIKHRITNYEGIDRLRIRWTTSLGTCLYSSTRDIPNPDSEQPIDVFWNFQAGIFEPEKEFTEKQFTSKITGIVFQILLYMLRPKAQAAMQNPISENTRKTKHQKRLDPKALRDFIWVGKDYIRKRIPHQGGSHRSPIGHPRSGHYRTLPWREIGEQEIWVSPTYVGGKD